MRTLNLTCAGVVLATWTAACDDSATPAPSDVAAETPDTVGPDGDADRPETASDDGRAEDALAAGDAAPIGTVWGEPGPFNVGHLETNVTYAPADGSPDRTLRLVLWYPTEAETGAEVLYGGLLPAEGVLGGAPPAAAPAAFPLVVFSHGNTSFAEQSHFLTTFLASHGFVVAAPDHTGNTFTAGDPPADIFHLRPLDVSAVLDHLLGAEAPEALAERLSDATAVAGHSFGGYTALAATGGAIDVDLLNGLCTDGTLPTTGCAAIQAHEELYRGGFADPRVDAAVPMTPGATVVFGADGLAGVEVPTLLMTGSLDRTTPDAEDGDPAWAVLGRRAGNLRASFTTAGHFTFSNGCDLAPVQLAEDGCSERFIPPERAHRAINAYTLAFLRRHLLDDARDAALLDGEVTLDPDVVLLQASPAER
jgi:predicted dienelactone hydrolase